MTLKPLNYPITYLPESETTRFPKMLYKLSGSRAKWSLLRAVPPSLRSTFDYLSTGLPPGKAPMETDSHLARTSRP